MPFVAWGVLHFLFLRMQKNIRSRNYPRSSSKCERKKRKKWNSKCQFFLLVLRNIFCQKHWELFARCYCDRPSTKWTPKKYENHYFCIREEDDFVSCNPATRPEIFWEQKNLMETHKGSPTWFISTNTTRRNRGTFRKKKRTTTLTEECCKFVVPLKHKCISKHIQIKRGSVFSKNNLSFCRPPRFRTFIDKNSFLSWIEYKRENWVHLW